MTLAWACWWHGAKKELLGPAYQEHKISCWLPSHLSQSSLSYCLLLPPIADLYLPSFVPWRSALSWRQRYSSSQPHSSSTFVTDLGRSFGFRDPVHHPQTHCPVPTWGFGATESSIWETRERNCSRILICLWCLVKGRNSMGWLPPHVTSISLVPSVDARHFFALVYSSFSKKGPTETWHTFSLSFLYFSKFFPQEIDISHKTHCYAI